MTIPTIHPLNVLDINHDSGCIECWHNGALCYTVHIGEQLADAVSRGQDWFIRWSGGKGSISRCLEDFMTPRCPECGYSETDALLHGDHHLCGGLIPCSLK